MMQTLAVLTLALVMQSSEDEELRRRIISQRVGVVDFPGVTLREVADRVAELSGANVVIQGITAEEIPPITITLTDVTLESVLGLILDEYKLTWTVRDGIVYIIKKAELPKMIEIYDVRDLLMPITNFPGVDMNLSSDSLGIVTTTEEAEEVQGITEDVLVELIKTHTGQGSWDEEGGSITNHSGLIVIRNRRDVHKQVERFLNELRKLM